MGQRILLFEGDPAFADEVRREFQALGATVDVVSDGAQGIELGEASRPDLILLTIELPGMNGFLVCKKIKKSDGLKDVPLMILSSEATEETFEQHKKLRTRADDYVRKPIAFGDLLTRVQRFVDLRSNGASAEAEDIVAVTDDDVIVIEESVPPAASPEAQSFANRAIDELMIGEPDEEEPIEAEPFEGIEAEPFEGLEAKLPAPPAAPVMSAGMRPSFVPPQDRVPGLERALDEAKERIAELERSLSRAEERAAGAERAAADAHKAAPGGSSKEFLELREQLNRKDRELVELRDQVTQRDRQLIEAKDQAFALERAVAEASDKRAEIEREAEKSRSVVEALQADKDGAKKRLDDLRGRLERSETKAREVEAERDVLVQEQQVALRAAEAKAAQAVADAVAAHRGELDRAEAQHAARAAQAERDHAAALERVRGEADAARESALDALRRELEEATRSQVAAAEARTQAAVAQKTQEHEAELTAVREQLEARRQETVREVGELETQLALVREQLEESENARKEGEANAARAREERSQQLDQIRALEGTIGRARAKIGTDAELLERVRKALAIGLGLLEDQKSNRFED